MSLAVLAGRDEDETLAAEVKRRFWHLHEMLATAHYTRPIAEACRRFYGLTSRLHEVRNRRARGAAIPVYSYNGHHHAARLWLDEVARRGALGPLLHFDSHDDMRDLTNGAAIMRQVAQLRRGDAARNAAMARLRQLITDHATPVSAGVLGQAIDNVVWASPSWAGTVEFARRRFHYADVDWSGAGRSFSLLRDASADDGSMDDRGSGRWVDVGDLTRLQRRSLALVRPIELSFIRTYPRRSSTVATLLDPIPRGRFILDIDLDYFLTVDAASGFERRVRDDGRALAGLRRYEHALAIARQLVDDRVSELVQLLAALRDAGRIPALVTIADSTYRPFAPFIAGAGYWEYTPIEFAAHAHWSVRQALSRVYDGHGIAAGT